LLKSLSDLEIHVIAPGVSASLQARKYPVVHIFAPATSRNASFVKKIAVKTHAIQTMLAAPTQSELERSICGQTAVVFSKQDEAQIKQLSPQAEVHVIPPCISLAPAPSLTPAATIRERYDVRDRMMVLALNDVCDELNFDSYLYMMREYNRRGGFRLLMPNYNRDKQTLLWRKRVQETIDKEKLTSTVLIDANDLHSLIDASDFVVDTRKQRKA